MPVPAQPKQAKPAPPASTLALLVLGTVATTLLAQATWQRLAWTGRPLQPDPLVAAAPSNQAIVDLNTATRAELAQLPGIGPTLAERIAAHRPYRSLAELDVVLGVGEHKLERLRPYLFVSQPTEARRVASQDTEPALDLNVATREQLILLPGIGPVLADRILEDRQVRGPYQRPEDLMRVKGIKNKLFERVRPHVRIQTEGMAAREKADG